MYVHATSETEPLKAVILGYPDNFHSNPSEVEVVNETQRHFYGLDLKPTTECLQPEFESLETALKNKGVEVFYPDPCDVPDQLTPRDIGFVINDTFFVASMSKTSRKAENEGIKFLTDQMDKVVQVPDDLVIEGGDIIVDKGVVFVGISQRTTKEGSDWLGAQIPDLSVVPVELKSLEDNEDCLHLDCAFVPVGDNHALVYPPGINEAPEESQRYKWIEVTKEEQTALATNVLSIDKKTVISRHSSSRVNEELAKIGLKVIEIKFDEAPKTGGSFRCCTLPLVREP